jgi:hypothetical protein
MPLNQRIDMYNWIMHNIGDMHKVWKIKERNQIEFSTWEDMVAFKITFGALGILK